MSAPSAVADGLQIKQMANGKFKPSSLQVNTANQRPVTFLQTLNKFLKPTLFTARLSIVKKMQRTLGSIVYKLIHSQRLRPATL
jgi:hypothetical protein